MKSSFLLAAIAATSYFREKPLTVDAFPDGVGGCMGGVAAVGGLHVDSSNGRAVVDGTLQDGNIRVTVGDVVLDAATVNEIPVGQDLLVGVEAGDVSFLGVLVRLQAPDGVDTTGALIPGANVRPAAACEAPVVGICHMNNDEKTLATGTLRFDEEIDGITLDVTIVFLNDPDGSAYVYNGFDIQTRALETDDIPSISPNQAESDTPSLASSITPSSPTSITQAPAPLTASTNPATSILPSSEEPVQGPVTPPAQPSAPEATPVTQPSAPAATPVAPPAPSSVAPSATNFPTPLESTAYPTFHGYMKKKPYYPYYKYGKGKKTKGSKKGYYYYGKGYGAYYGKGESKKSKSKKSKSSSSSSSGYKNAGGGGKGVHGGQLFLHRTPAENTRTGGGHRHEPIVSVFDWRRQGEA